MKLKLYAEKFRGTMFSLHGHALILAALWKHENLHS